MTSPWCLSRLIFGWWLLWLALSWAGGPAQLSDSDGGSPQGVVSDSDASAELNEELPGYKGEELRGAGNEQLTDSAEHERLHDLKNRLPLAETLHDFAEAFNIFLHGVHRPYEKHKYVIKLQQIRDWKSFLGLIRKKVTGIMGQSAPHVFSCVKRSTLPAATVETLLPGADDDVILRCRQWMGDRCDCAAKEYLCQADLLKMPGKVPSEVLPLCNLTKEFKDMIEKGANMMARQPYNLTRASTALLGWIHRTDPLDPLLDISYVMLEPARHVAGADMPLPGGEHTEVHAMTLEPHVTRLSIVSGPNGTRREECKASEQAQFVYPLALTLEQEHVLPWEQCLGLAEKCWKN